MQKKLRSISLAVLLVLSLSVSALATTPRWNYTDDCIPALSFRGTTANCGVTITGKAGTSKISATVLLQKNNGGTYTTVSTWDETVYAEKYTLDDSVTGCARGSYRLYVSATVYNSAGKSEVVSNYVTGNC